MDWQEPVNLIVGWCRQFLFFVVLRQFSQVVGEWPENQILIPDWIYFYCPGTTLIQNKGTLFNGDFARGYASHSLGATSLTVKKGTIKKFSHHLKHRHW